MILKRFHHRATVLIFALCILAALTAFAVALGARIRQKFTLVSRLNGRDQIQALSHSGVNTARYFIANGPYAGNPFGSAAAKQQWFNNPLMFKDIHLSTGGIDFQYGRHDDMDVDQRTLMYGFEDEGGKLNINTAERSDLVRLFVLVAHLSQGDAEDLANAILDWRELGETEISGFYGEDYYAKLTYPYKPKKAPFENLSEVQLLKGMNPDVFLRVKDFITVYGDGGVNINTASRLMLIALGMSSHTAQILVEGRKGPDGIEATSDDFIFLNSGNINFALRGFVELTPNQVAEIEALYVLQKIVMDSEFVTAHIQVYLPITQENRAIDCVFRIDDGKITEWR